MSFGGENDTNPKNGVVWPCHWARRSVFAYWERLRQHHQTSTNNNSTAPYIVLTRMTCKPGRMLIPDGIAACQRISPFSRARFFFASLMSSSAVLPLTHGLAFWLSLCIFFSASSIRLSSELFRIMLSICLLMTVVGLFAVVVNCYCIDIICSGCVIRGDVDGDNGRQ